MAPEEAPGLNMKSTVFDNGFHHFIEVTRSCTLLRARPCSRAMDNASLQFKRQPRSTNDICVSHKLVPEIVKRVSITAAILQLKMKSDLCVMYELELYSLIRALTTLRILQTQQAILQVVI